MRQQLREILAKRTDVLSPRMIGIIEDLSGDWRRLDERIERVTEEIEQLAHGSESCRQLMTVPGIGPLIASAMVAAIANGAAFAKGKPIPTRHVLEAVLSKVLRGIPRWRGRGLPRPRENRHEMVARHRSSRRRN